MTVMKHFGRVVGLSLGRVSFYFRLTFTFQLLDKLCSQASSLLPSGTCLQFSSRISFSIPTARRFSSNVANSRSRAFRKSVCALGWVELSVFWWQSIDHGSCIDFVRPRLLRRTPSVYSPTSQL